LTLPGCGADRRRRGRDRVHGSGSEADNLAIRGTLLGPTDHRRQVITQATEHPAVLATCHALHRLHDVALTGSLPRVRY
jgi:hypothetical protein